MSLDTPVSPRTPTPQEDSVWSKGDFVLVSSDHVSFRVPSYYLQCWSDVFQAMMEIGDGKRLIHVSDNSKTIRLFLHLVTNLRLDIPALESDGLFDNVLALVGFMEKYSCTLGLALFLERLETEVYGGRWPHLLLFLVGARLGRERLCRNVIASNSDKTWLAFERELRPKGVALELYTLDYRSLSKELLELLPVEYGYSLACAGIGKTLPDKRFEGKTPQDRFLAFLELCSGKQIQ